MHRSPARTARTSLMTMCAMFTTLSCAEKAPAEVERVATVEVTPSSSTVPIGSVMTLTAEPRDDGGNPVRNLQIFWSSSDTTVAVVSPAGVVSARGSGEARIAATAQGVSSLAIVRVSSSPPVSQQTVTRVVVTPPSGVVRTSGSQTFRSLQLTATAYDADNRVVSGRSFTWTVDKGNLATVDGNGLVRAVKEGEVVVSAATGSVTGRANILVVK